MKHGFRGPVYCTPGTRDLCAILLPDSGHLQEKDAEFANRHGFSKHHPALPLYTLDDAEASLKRFAPIEFDEDKRLSSQLRFRFVPAGHILGAAMVELTCGGTKVVFSGDLGRPNSAIVVDPTPIHQTDYLLVESTYGNRKHEAKDPEDVLADIINRTAGRGGTVVIPSFAVGRAQLLMYHLRRLKQQKRIPELADLPGQPDGAGSERAVRQACRRGKAEQERGARGVRRRALCHQRGGIEGARPRSHAQGHHLGERHGDRRPRAASPQALRARTRATPSCSPASRPAARAATP